MPKAKSKTGKARIVVAGKVYKKDSCSTTKTAAKSVAKKLRLKGMRARVVTQTVETAAGKKKKIHCVFLGGKSKTAKKKKAA
jgi:UDP-N-acetyl-D-mannosaminuronate dehydrogenase